jgi:hypothetical protein
MARSACGGHTGDVVVDLPSDVVELIGVYNADGGWRGELAYAVGHLRGTTHCSLCDITHATVARKRTWVALVEALPVPFVLLHRNERPYDVRAVTGDSTPAVLVRRRGDAAPSVVLGPDDLEPLDGEVAAFVAALNEALRRR